MVFIDDYSQELGTAYYDHHHTYPSSFSTSSSSSSLAVQAHDPTLHLPRVLCLHGGGTNSRIFKAQCRVLRAQLGSYFRLVFPDAPYYSVPGPDVESVYSGWKPFRCWLPASLSGPAAPAVQTLTGAAVPLVTAGPEDVEAIDRSLLDAMAHDDAEGATGRWVGVLGFSQGAKVAASLLFRQQQQVERSGFGYIADQQSSVATDLSFAVLMAGRAPLVRLELAVADDGIATPPATEFVHTLHLPTLHVHGLRDPNLKLHQKLMRHCCDKGTTAQIEWDGDHRVPVKTRDVRRLVDEMLKMATWSGVL